jgi:hypothetical protein
MHIGCNMETYTLKKHFSSLNYSILFYGVQNKNVSIPMKANKSVLLLYACAHKISLKYLFPEKIAIEICC